MRIVELIIDEKDETSGIDAVSVVESPAIESDFIALKKHEIELKEVDAEKRILMGAALIPNKQIYRKNDKNEEYYIYFSEETVRKASELFFMNSNQNNATLEHKQKLDGMSVVESWITEGKNDKSTNYGFNFPKGTWVISIKVNNDEIWNKVKLGEVKGFSIEGYFADKYEMSLNNIEMEEKVTIEKIKELITKSELSKHDIKLIGQITDYTKEVESIYSDMSSKAEILKKEYRLKTATLQKPLVTLRAKIYVSSVEFLEKTGDLGIDGKSTTPYKQYEKLIQDVDKMNAYFVKEYGRNI
jgi:hypothetical protein